MGYTSGKSKLRVNEKGSTKTGGIFRMKAKRITALLAAAAMAVSLMTGCSSGGGEANNPSDETDKEDGGIV